MLEKKKEYIDKLLTELKELEMRVSAIKNEDALPFSFFRESFTTTQSISRLLHELELLQIEDMKHQMEKLVVFLSETGNSKEQKIDEKIPVEPIVEVVESIEEVEIPKSSEFPEISEESEAEKPRYNSYAEGIVLPEYKNPRLDENGVSETVENKLNNVVVPPTVRPLSETIEAPQTVLDLKRGISLNDRFLFQRELFHNNRHEMDNMMIKLNAFSNYEEAKSYIRENTSWNFESEIVKDFLSLIKKGME